MATAEDRILGFEICATAGKSWTLRYNHAAQAATDVPDSVVGLIKQRRRWLNGSFFAMLYTLGLWHRLLIGNNHTIVRKIFFVIIYLWNVRRQRRRLRPRCTSRAPFVRRLPVSFLRGFRSETPTSPS